MGFNTVAFILNDLAHELRKSPHTTSFIVGCPYEGTESSYHRRQVESEARENGESVPHTQAIKVFPSFHADGRKFYMAGRNSMSELKIVRTQMDRSIGRRVVVLELPEYLQESENFKRRW